MGKQLRKTLEVPIFDEPVLVDVSFRIIEVVERIYSTNADMVSVDLGNPVRVQRHKVAAVMAEWLRGREKELGHSRAEIIEHVTTAPPDRLNVYVGSIQGAILYSLKYINDDQLAALSRGEDLPDDDDDDAGGKQSPKANGETSASETTASSDPAIE